MLVHKEKQYWMKCTTIVLTSILLVISLVSGCSPATRYKTLCFFFDGVPDPNAPPEGIDETGNESSAALRANVRRSIESYHEPYQKMKCSSCHNPPERQVTTEKKGMLIKTTEEGLCQTCHKTIPDKVPYIHAPALVNACLECHHHHRAGYRKLLLKGGDDLCYRCHSKSDLSEGIHHKEPLSEPDDLATTCVKCHNPHHGRARYFLIDEMGKDVNAPTPSALTSPQDASGVKGEK